MAVSERNDGAVVFVRHFNDVDHIGPVAIAASKAMPVRLIITHTDARAHPLVGVLPTVSSVEVRDLAELLGTATEAAARSGVEGGDLEPALLFDGVSDNPVVALDWDYSEFAGRVCDAARNLGLTTVSLPHGDAPYINLLINLDDIDGGLARHYERATRYDHTVVPNSRCAIRYPFLSPERLHVLGSPRYNDAWRRELERLAPATPHRSESEGRRIAFLLRNANFPIHWEEVMRALAMIADSGPVDVAVKHHTRDKMMDTVLDAHPRLRPGRHGAIDVVDKGVASRALLGWAELVIDLGTSIAFEAVLDAVPVVSLEYVHANRSTVAAHLPASDLRCREDLAAVLRRLHAGKVPVSIGPDEVANFRRDLVEPNGPDVLEAYVDLLRSATPATGGPAAGSHRRDRVLSTSTAADRPVGR